MEPHDSTGLRKSPKVDSQEWYDLDWAIEVYRGTLWQSFEDFEHHQILTHHDLQSAARQVVLRAVLPEDALNDYAIARGMQYLWTFLDSLWPDYFRCFCKRGKQRWLPEQKLYLCNHADCMITGSYKKDDDTLSFWDGAAVDDPSKDKTLTHQDAWIRSGVDASRVKVF